MLSAGGSLAGALASTSEGEDLRHMVATEASGVGLVRGTAAKTAYPKGDLIDGKSKALNNLPPRGSVTR